MKPLINVASFGLVPVPPMPGLAQFDLQLRQAQALIDLPENVQSSSETPTPTVRSRHTRTRTNLSIFFVQLQRLAALFGSRLEIKSGPC